MTANGKISVLIPAYNVGAFIHETFDSLLNQTYSNWECYCVDDGSTDNTYEIMQRYAQKDSRFHVFQQKNSGVTKTSNFLLNQPDETTKYLYYLDSDDYIHPQTFEILVKIQNDSKADVVQANYMRVSNEKPSEYFKKIEMSSLSTRTLTDMSIYLLKKTREDFKKKNALKDQWVNKPKLYLWQKIKSLRFNEDLSYEDDYFYSSQLHTLIDSKVIIDYPLYYYRYNSSSLTRSVNYQKYQEACIARIYATHAYFVKGGRVPKNILTDFQKDVAEDACRMIGIKPVRRCKDKDLRKKLFYRACLVLADMRAEGIMDDTLLPFHQRLIMCAYRCRSYYLARFLILFK